MALPIGVPPVMPAELEVKKEVGVIGIVAGVAARAETVFLAQVAPQSTESQFLAITAWDTALAEVAPQAVVKETVASQADMGQLVL